MADESRHALKNFYSGLKSSMCLALEKISSGIIRRTLVYSVPLLSPMLLLCICTIVKDMEWLMGTKHTKHLNQYASVDRV